MKSCHRCRKPFAADESLFEVIDDVPLKWRKWPNESAWRITRYHLKCLPPNMSHKIQGSSLGAAPDRDVPQH